MTFSSNLDTCLGITGTFEGGKGVPRWDLLTGNFDGQGLSAGCLQWCAGQGSLQDLLRHTIGDWPVAHDEFEPIFLMKDMLPKVAVPYAIKTWVDPKSVKKNLTVDAVTVWSKLLKTDQCVNAQRTLAQGILDHALVEADHFMPDEFNGSSRMEAFFFDLRVQQGGMSKRFDNGKFQTPGIISTPEQATSAAKAIALATAQGRTKTANAWSLITSTDPLAKILLHYAYERAMMSRPEYQWDTLSRRGTIACRQGCVHGGWFNFTTKLV